MYKTHKNNFMHYAKLIIFYEEFLDLRDSQFSASLQDRFESNKREINPNFITFNGQPIQNPKNLFNLMDLRGSIKKILFTFKHFKLF